MMQRSCLHLPLCTLMLVVLHSGIRPAPAAEASGYSWGANTGWISWDSDEASSSAFNERFAWGFIYSANTGWISLGDGSPLDGHKYSNASADDFGVNLDLGSDPDQILLYGYAYSANTGWINFDVADAAGDENQPRIDRTTGALTGTAWSANTGWIVLDTGLAEPTSTGLILPSSEWVSEYILGLRELVGEVLDAADVNEDGTVNIADIIQLINLEQ